ncbi:MerR family DNA-binding protein [Paucilactobacillus nenjiangensis]|uniref:MerR family DNA-binding protein n=1 Tax=Paucilactobacillus nenjiangensis TaxID=1296540 RepID=UPI003FA313AD
MDNNLGGSLQRGVRNLRLYDQVDLEHVALVRRLKNGGFSLDEILEYTTIRDQGVETIPTRLTLMADKITQLQAKQEAIDASIKYLEEKMLILEAQEKLK